MPEETRERWLYARVQVGHRVRIVRGRRGLTQEALALASGLSRNQLIEIEHGRSGLLVERLLDLASALNVPPAELLKIDGDLDAGPTELSRASRA